MSYRLSPSRFNRFAAELDQPQRDMLERKHFRAGYSPDRGIRHDFDLCGFGILDKGAPTALHYVREPTRAVLIRAGEDDSDCRGAVGIRGRGKDHIGGGTDEYDRC